MRADRIAKRMRLRDHIRIAKEKKVKTLLHTTYKEAINLGMKLGAAKIHNSVAGLDYGGSYYVAPTVEGSEDANRGGDSVPVSGGLDDVAPADDPNTNDTCPNPEVFG